MDSGYVQNLRYKLQKRVRRLNSTGYELFHSSLKQFWRYLHSQPVLAGIVARLELGTRRAIADMAGQIVHNRQPHLFETEMDQVGGSYWVLRQCVEANGTIPEVYVGAAYGKQKENNDNLEYFRDIFLEPFYDYLDEQLDDQRLMLALLRRYKHKCEWFQRTYLFESWQDCTRKGEGRLAYHMYEYLHDQGLEFLIEPSSASGEVDMIASQQGEELPADAPNVRQGLATPPVVRILSPKEGEVFQQPRVNVDIEAVDEGDGVEDVRLYHNGKRIGG